MRTDQQRAVTESLFALSYWNFHRGRRVPSCSLNSSEASSKYLKSETDKKDKDELKTKERHETKEMIENICILLDE